MGVHVCMSGFCNVWAGVCSVSICVCEGGHRCVCVCEHVYVGMCVSVCRFCNEWVFW